MGSPQCPSRSSSGKGGAEGDWHFLPSDASSVLNAEKEGLIYIDESVKGSQVMGEGQVALGELEKRRTPGSGLLRRISNLLSRALPVLGAGRAVKWCHGLAAGMMNIFCRGSASLKREIPTAPLIHECLSPLLWVWLLCQRAPVWFRAALYSNSCVPTPKIAPG